jgi:hypothetical protein
MRDDREHPPHVVVAQLPGTRSTIIHCGDPSTTSGLRGSPRPKRDQSCVVVAWAINGTLLDGDEHMFSVLGRSSECICYPVKNQLA